MGEFVISVIEDDKGDQKQIVEHCEDVGKDLGIKIQSGVFASARDFLRDFRKNQIRPDVMIVDLRLGEAADDRAGWKAVGGVLKLAVVPVVVYSAFASEEVPKGFKNLLIVPVIKGSGHFRAILHKCCLLRLRLNEEWQRVKNQFAYLTLETIGKLLGPGCEIIFWHLCCNGILQIPISLPLAALINRG